jgi:regulator of sigma D
MQREEALQSLCQFVNDDLTPGIVQLYQMIVRRMASFAADGKAAPRQQI